jgi:hypothetical protein
MRGYSRARNVRGLARAGVILGALLACAGCSPYSTAAKIGIKVVGDAVHDSDVSKRSEQLLGQPVAAADTMFGQRIRTLEQVQTKRQVITYPVKDDLLNMYRWAVEVQGDKIVALAKLQNDPDGGKDIAQKLVLKEIAVGKTPQQVETHNYFKKLVLTLRDCANGDMLRVYDIALIPDFMGAKYCVLRFDASGTCQEVRIVGVPASTKGSSVGK